MLYEDIEEINKFVLSDMDPDSLVHEIPCLLILFGNHGSLSFAAQRRYCRCNTTTSSFLMVQSRSKGGKHVWLEATFESASS
jgi:hypothetical protein